MRLGIFGGSFDPIHLGHLIVAEYTKELMNLDKIIFIPVGNPSLCAAAHPSARQNPENEP